MRIYLSLFIITLFSSCGVGDTKNSNVVSVNEVKPETSIKDEEKTIYEWSSTDFYIYRDIAFEAVKTGNTKMYDKASDWYFRSSLPENFLFFANLMAKKHDYGRAYYDVYSIYNGIYKIYDENDSLMVNFVYYNLAKAHELGHNIRFETILGKDVTNENIGLPKDYVDN